MASSWLYADDVLLLASSGGAECEAAGRKTVEGPPWSGRSGYSKSALQSYSWTRGDLAMSAVMPMLHKSVIVKRELSCKSKSVDLPVDLLPHHNPWSQALGSDWKNKVADTIEISFLWSLAGLCLRNWLSLVILKIDWQESDEVVQASD